MMRERPCPWPHQILTPESEARLTKAMARHRKWIRAEARRLSLGDRYVRHEIEHAALLELWTTGWEAIEGRSDAETHQKLHDAMRYARRRELRLLLAGRRAHVRGLNA